MITYIVPYYRAPAMLRLHLDQWANYDLWVRHHMGLLIVDDGSPEPAEPIVREALAKDPELPVTLLRIKEDIPWNRNGARNLGSKIAVTPWLLHTDIDHLLHPAEALLLIRCHLDAEHWYRFRRYRVGAADDTRNKDAIPRDAVYGEIKPHGDSYLCTKDRYWFIGGYDEDYSGHLGGGSPFIQSMAEMSEPVLLPVALHVYTRSVVSDASVSTLSRDTSHYTNLKMKKKRTAQTKSKNPLRFTWERLI